MKKSTKIAIICLAAVLLVIVIIAIFNFNNNKTEAVEPPITASSVKFSKTGQYKTTVESKEIDLSGISTDNVEISYKGINNELKTDSETGFVTETGLKETVKAKVESIVKNDNGSYDITFTDEKVNENAPTYYEINFKNNNAATIVNVAFPKIELKPDVEYVTVGSTTNKITLAIDGSEFENGITKEDIKLGNSFADMTVEDVSSSNKYLTMQLSGKPSKSVANSYEFGSISVNPNVIKDGYADTTAKIDIKIDYAGFDDTSLKFADGKITADIVMYGVSNADAITKDNTNVEGVTIESVDKKNDNTVTVTMTANDINSINDFVDLVSNKTLTIGDYKTEIELSQATFYPVFDYVEKAGDNLKLTLKLYTLGGTFDKGLNNEKISFADDFKDAKIDSVKVDSDGVSTLIITVPANGQTVETMKMTGTVNLAEGSIINNWGEKCSKPLTYIREFSNETLGKDVSLNAETLLEIQKYTRGLNTTFGKICYWGGIAGQVFSIGKSILEATGAIESDHAEEIRYLKEISAKLDSVLTGIGKVREDISANLSNIYKSRLDNYNIALKDLKKQMTTVRNVYIHGMIDVIDSNPRWANVDFSKLSDREADELNHEVMEYIIDRNSNERESSYYLALTKIYDLLHAFNKVCSFLETNDENNALNLCDQACALAYSFDSQCYDVRLSYRVDAEKTLTEAYALLAFRYDIGYNLEKNIRNPEADFFGTEGIHDSYHKAMDTIQKLSDVGHPAEEIDAVQALVEVEGPGQYIGDVLLAGDAESPEAAKKYLIDRGYTVIDYNLNKGVQLNNGGHYIYLGYKTTDNYNDAIKRFNYSLKSNITTTDSFITLFSCWDGYKPNSQSTMKTFHLVPYVGDERFVREKGNVDTGIDGANYNYIYYSKDDFDDKKAVVNIYFDNSYIDAPDQGNRTYATLNPYTNNINYQNREQFGEPLYLLYDTSTTPKEAKTYKPAGKDPEYYPYSYIFGRKVSVIQSRDTTNDAVFYNTKTLTLKDDLRTYYNWDEESQINPFIARCHGVSVKDTLKSAGINISDPIYAVGRIEEKTYHGNQWESYRYYVIIGTLIDINTNSVNKDVHLRRFKGDGEYNQQPTRYDSYMNAKLQDVVKFCLY